MSGLGKSSAVASASRKRASNIEASLRGLSYSNAKHKVSMRAEMRSGGLEVTGRLYSESESIHIFIEKVFRHYDLQITNEDEIHSVIRDLLLNPKAVRSVDFSSILERIMEGTFGSSKQREDTGPHDEVSAVSDFTVSPAKRTRREIVEKKRWQEEDEASLSSDLHMFVTKFKVAKTTLCKALEQAPRENKPLRKRLLSVQSDLDAGLQSLDGIARVAKAVARRAPTEAAKVRSDRGKMVSAKAQAHGWDNVEHTDPWKRRVEEARQILRERGTPFDNRFRPGSELLLKAQELHGASGSGARPKKGSGSAASKAELKKAGGSTATPCLGPVQ